MSTTPPRSSSYGTPIGILFLFVCFEVVLEGRVGTVRFDDDDDDLLLGIDGAIFALWTRCSVLMASQSS